MNKKEALQVLAILKAAYPHSYNGMSKEEALGTVSVWCVQFANISADIVLMAVNKLISSCKFPPSIAEVKSKIEGIHWEAYEVISENDRFPSLSQQELNTYKRIYTETENFRYSSKMAEPPISQLLHFNSGAEVKMLE